MLASLFLSDYPGLDGRKVLLMCLLHDLGEIYEGDISAAECPDESKKYQEEYRAVTKVLSLLPGDLSSEYQAVWQEYEDNQTPESRLVKALDKAETIIQHNQGQNPDGFDYDFNLNYGQKYFSDDERLRELRSILDAETATHMD